MAMTFKGRIPSTPFCVDDFSQLQVRSFQSSPLSATCPLLFFLSHLHADHTVGLSSSWNHGPIYTSPLTAHLLLSRYPSLDPSLVHPLPYHTPTTLPLSTHSPLTFTLTLLPTLHCPGSSLFLFDGYFGRLIYTGDLRLLSPPPPPLLSPPHPTLYLDDTYAHHPHPFLTRSHTVASITRIARAHPFPHYRVVLNGDLLGKEDVLVMVAVRLRCVVCVEEDKWRVLQALWEAGYDLNEQNPPEEVRGGRPEAEEGKEGEGERPEEEEEEEGGEEDSRALSHPTWLSYFTTNKAETSLHVLPKRLLTRANIRAFNAQGLAEGGVRTVGVLVSGWAGGREASDGCGGEGGCLHCVCYSSHCSQAELKALVKAVRPAVVRGISTAGNGEWCREWLSGEGEKVVEVPKELTHGLWKDGETGHRMRARGVRRQRSDPRSMMGEGRRRRAGFVLEPKSSQSADEAEDGMGGGGRGGDVLDEIRLDMDEGEAVDGSGEVMVVEELSSDGQEGELQRASSIPRSPPLCRVTMDESVRRFSLPCNPARNHLLSRISLCSFELLDTGLPLLPAPRQVPAFLSNSSSVVHHDSQRPSLPPPNPLERRPGCLPLSSKRRALMTTRPALPLTSLTSDAARKHTSHSSPHSPSPARRPSTSSAPASLALLDSVVFPPHVFPQLSLSRVSVEQKRREAEEEEKAWRVADSAEKENRPSSSAPASASSESSSCAAVALVAEAPAVATQSCAVDMPPLEAG